MGCTSCGSSPGGCQSKGNCATGGCNRLNTYDWLSMKNIPDPTAIEVVEVSYKSGARKDFCHRPAYMEVNTGDMVVVDEGNGFNMGRISLSGELVRLQMRKKNASKDRVLHTVVRRANPRDLDRLDEARAKEKPTLVKSRAIARTMGLDMKIGDVEYRGDGRKATFYYTSDGRVDFRELVRSYAGEFRVKIEMRQIGARQESARIGGLGACGRELCCSTWLTDFKSVTTSAARYQNLSINQTKLSGQCGRLKCCLNYELDTYIDALKDIPKNVDRLKTKIGSASLIKTDIFKRLLYYAYETERGRSNIIAVEADRVKEIKEMNAKNEFPEDLIADIIDDGTGENVIIDFEDVTGFIELPEEKRKRRGRRRGGRNKQRKSSNQGGRQQRQPSGKSGNSNPKGGGNQPKSDGPSRSSNRRRGRPPRKDSNQNKS